MYIKIMFLNASLDIFLLQKHTWSPTALRAYAIQLDATWQVLHDWVLAYMCSHTLGTVTYRKTTHQDYITVCPYDNTSSVPNADPVSHDKSIVGELWSL